jgi:hypothetical protein
VTLLYRLLGVTLAKGHQSLFSVVLMSIAAAALTALTEASLISIASGVAFGRVLALNFSLELGMRPAWIVVLPGIILACAGIAPRYQALTGIKTPGASAAGPISRRP